MAQQGGLKVQTVLAVYILKGKQIEMYKLSWYRIVLMCGICHKESLAEGFIKLQ